MNKKSVFTFILPAILSVLFFVLSVKAAQAGQDYNVSNQECKIEADLQGSVSQNSASVTNYSQNPNCEYEATLALYNSPQQPGSPRWIDAQTLIGSKTVLVKAGETVNITVEGDSDGCWIQADLIRGRHVLEPPVYVNAMAVDVYSQECEGQVDSITSVMPSPTPTCTPTPTNIPTPTTTPGATNTPTPDPTNTPTPAVGKVQAAEATFAGTGNSALIYSVVLAGAASIIIGLILKRFSR